ncbi:aldehyde oxidase [Heyndrickxia shackletonii]|uniref:Aldehyde oxidase n=1 Tax=Heyndrickxia shackletonii TaxID=157838 RepID=A0A0Q3WWQ3_9BACI|nr:xanthine dehydrogenase family protein molybdopterin-binding subunit [Heyndrickxia shackletonii]KQL53861.1 aldehyde oxidase [Heyndrickxia shackletonii]MBB2481893.1 xanthine dehydrogenase family protein molybdopterin-binding subunit [Bacillus sp. APMAM]NEY97866.1 xanthine dehydrogenase family protein molybdopterin-binding subunit [Heyndrickxia shackletonii]RTZ54738.1 xanthine dehydrogenase family protein molybdopterin-binding subunit [Bacillus sp. SAJ1]
MSGLGKSIIRKEALNKVTGNARYTNDIAFSHILETAFVRSPHAHAKILSIDISQAKRIHGVRAIITGENLPMTGEDILDHPPLAYDKVRHYGEPVVMIVAEKKYQAKQAANFIKVNYSPLPVVNSPLEAMQQNSPLVHENLGKYEVMKGIYPVPSTNIANHTKIRKGNIDAGFSKCDVIVEKSYSFTQADHAAMETRCATAEITPSGIVIIHSSSQAPYLIKKSISSIFNIEEGKVDVHTPLVGGAYGGKAAIQLEYLAYIASRAVGGKPVKVLNSREEDLIMSPVHIGLTATVKIGCTSDGKIQAAKYTYLFDGGAYSDKGVDMSKSAGIDCTGPYNIENVWCDSYCMYTNHPYSTSFRGFSHSELTFAADRTMDILAKELNMDPIDFRLINAIKEGDTTPTQTPLTKSNIGNMTKCLKRLKELIGPNINYRQKIGNGKIRSLGISGLWKTSNIDSDAGSGAIITFNNDGSMNLNCGLVELGQGTKTALTQIIAERFKMDVDMVHVKMSVDTEITPEHWKTVASRGTFMVGRAVMDACNDAIAQFKHVAAKIFLVEEEDLEVGEGKVYLRANPVRSIPMAELAHGYKYPKGSAIGGEIIGRGKYILRNIVPIDPETGKGVPGPEWTVGAEAVEVEYDEENFTYELKRVFAVIDCGRLINPLLAKGQVMGAAHMGLSFATREKFDFSNKGEVLNPQLRTYHMLRYGENPEYIVDFVETPFLDSPYGIRGIGEHGIIGIPAALANSLSNAMEKELMILPLTPENLWRIKNGVQS